MENALELLELRVIRSSVGELETNIGTVEEYVARRLEDYTPEKFEGDADTAKKKRAELNTAKKQVGDTRRQIMARIMQPYRDFEERCKVLERNIDLASARLDEIVKRRESEEKEAKKALCRMVWDEKGFTLFPMEKVFNPKWLNKGTKKSAISAEMDAIIDKVYKDFKTIERFGDDAELLKALYLEDLDLEAVFSKADEIQRNRERVAEESAGREARETAGRLTAQKKDVAAEAREQKRKNIMESLAADALEEPVHEPKEKEYVLSFKATADQKIALETFLVNNGIYFDSLKELEF